MNPLYIMIKPEEISKAKEEMKVFDSQKTYNKFVCSNNYIGLLGEMVLDRYLKQHNINHTWVPFTKMGTNQPDFYINGCSIDLKTSSGPNMWVTSHCPHDIYISAQVTKDISQLEILGWLTNNCIKLAKDRNTATQFTNGSNKAYIINKADLLPVSLLTGVFSSSPVSLFSEVIQ